MRHRSNGMFLKFVDAAFIVGNLMGVNPLHINIEIGLLLAKAALQHAKSRPLDPSHRQYLIAVGMRTHNGNWFDGYNNQPNPGVPFSVLRAHGVDPEGVRRFRTCGEQYALLKANDAGDIWIEMIVLYGHHHDNGDGDPPEPCEVCLRTFTQLNLHRQIFIVMVHDKSGRITMATAGELIDKASPLGIECECCKGVVRYWGVNPPGQPPTHDK